MKAFLISAEKQAIEMIDITGMDDIVNLIGYDTIESDEVGTEGDRLFFDEECFLRGSAGRFKIDTMIPVSGKAILVGANEDGSTLSDVSTDLNDLGCRIQYI